MMYYNLTDNLNTNVGRVIKLFTDTLKNLPVFNSKYLIREYRDLDNLYLTDIPFIGVIYRSITRTVDKGHLVYIKEKLKKDLSEVIGDNQLVYIALNEGITNIVRLGIVLDEDSKVLIKVNDQPIDSFMLTIINTENNESLLILDYTFQDDDESRNQDYIYTIVDKIDNNQSLLDNYTYQELIHPDITQSNLTSNLLTYQYDDYYKDDNIDSLSLRALRDIIN